MANTNKRNTTTDTSDEPAAPITLKCPACKAGHSTVSEVRECLDSYAPQPAREVSRKGWFGDKVAYAIYGRRVAHAKEKARSGGVNADMHWSNNGRHFIAQCLSKSDKKKVKACDFPECPDEPKWWVSEDNEEWFALCGRHAFDDHAWDDWSNALSESDRGD